MKFRHIYDGPNQINNFKKLLKLLFKNVPAP
jgi:activator of HSP90 ATPase